MKKRTPAKKVAAKVKKLVVPPKHVAHVIVPVGMIPAIVPGKVPHEVAIIPVKAVKQESWMEWLFGPPEKLDAKP